MVVVVVVGAVAVVVVMCCGSEVDVDSILTRNRCRRGPRRFSFHIQAVAAFILGSLAS